MNSATEGQLMLGRVFKCKFGLAMGQVTLCTLWPKSVNKLCYAPPSLRFFCIMLFHKKFCQKSR